MPYSYQWSHGPTQREVNGLGRGTYRLQTKDANGCVAVDSITLIDGADIFEVSEAIQPGCNGDGRGAIDLVLNPLYEPYSVLWSSSTIYENNGWGITNLVPGSYGVFIEDGNGCQYNKAYTIDTLNPLIVSSQTELISCQGNTDGKILLELESSNGPVEYQLNDGIFQTQPLFLNLGPGMYSVTSIDEAGCVLFDTLELVDPPLLMIDLGNDTTVRRGQELVITPIVNIDNPNFVYQWIISQDGPEACDGCQSFLSNPEKSFSVRVIVSDGGICYAEDFIKVVVNNEFNVLVPTAFTPNNDGLNDRLLVHGSKGVLINHFQVFDRAYNLLYEDYNFDINDFNRGWDGQSKGRDSKETIVIWKVRATLDEEVEQTFSGTSKIIRN